jgi:hypothetical protein
VLIGNADATDAFGIWNLYGADFSVNSNSVPSLTNIQDITPAGTKWVETGNFSPYGQHMLLSSDIGLTDAEGQDQWVLDINTGKLPNLTNSANVWDEHGYCRWPPSASINMNSVSRVYVLNEVGSLR